MGNDHCTKGESDTNQSAVRSAAALSKLETGTEKDPLYLEVEENFL